MDDVFYNASFTIYSLPNPTAPRLLHLLSKTAAGLDSHAADLHNHLTTKSSLAAYEAEEEAAKIGSLRSCSLTHLTASTGLAFKIVYDRATYHFILHTNDSCRLPLLLAKAPASFTNRMISYIETIYHTSPFDGPSQLSSLLMLTILQSYISSVRKSLDHLTENESILSLLHDIVGVLKITVNVNPSSLKGAAVAPYLRKIDLDVPSDTLYQLLGQSLPERPTGRSKRKAEAPEITFLDTLQSHFMEKTGLKLPITPESAKTSEKEQEPTLKVTRIHTTAFAIGTEGKLKFGSKPVELMDVVPGLSMEKSNLVRLANKDLLDSMMKEALNGGKS